MPALLPLTRARFPASALLRSSLDSGAALVSVADELNIVRAYLDIERVRFGDRLRYEVRSDGDAGENEEPPQDLGLGEPGAEPQPFPKSGDGGGETLGHQHGDARAQERQGSVDAKIAQTHADQATEQEPWGARAGETVAEGVCEHAEHAGGDEQTSDVGAHRSTEAHTVAGAGGVKRKKKRGEKRGEHPT